MGDKRKNEREALRGWAENGHEGKKTTKKNDEKKRITEEGAGRKK